MNKEQTLRAIRKAYKVWVRVTVTENDDTYFHVTKAEALFQIGEMSDEPSYRVEVRKNGHVYIG